MRLGDHPLDSGAPLLPSRPTHHRRGAPHARWVGAAWSRGAIGLCLVLAVLAATSVASALQADIAKAAAEPIMRQLEAFRQNDYDAAYVFASAEIKQMFDRPAFERMVKGGYPEIARSTFAIISRTEVRPDGHVNILVRVNGANGLGIEALYEMVRESDGWKVNGVATRPDPGLVLAPRPSGTTTVA